jgi:cell division protein FtsB
MVMQDELKTKFAKIISRERLPSRLLFCGFYHPEEAKPASMGDIFYFLEIVSPWFPNTSVAQTVIKTIVENYYQQSSLETALNLEITLKEVNARIAEVAAEGDNDWVSNLNGIIGVVKNGELHFSQVGSLVGYMIREKKIVQITENKSLKQRVSPLRVFEQLTSGELIPGDRLIFANSQLLNHISPERLRTSFQTEQIEVGLEEIFRQLKKTKAKEINTLVFEANSQDEFSKKMLSNCPDVFYLDLPLDSRLLRYRKAAGPYLKKSAELAKIGFEKSKIAYKKSKQYYHDRIRPKAREIYHKGKETTINGLKSTNHKIAPAIKSISNGKAISKIKYTTRPYLKTTGTFWGKTLRIIRPYFGNVRQIFNPKNRKFLYIGLAIIVLTFAFLKIRSNNQAQVDLRHQEEVAAAFEEGKNTYSQALVDIGLNRNDVGFSKLLLAQELAKKALESDFNRSEVETLLSNIQQKIDEISITKRVSAEYLFAENLMVVPKIILYSNNNLYLISEAGEIALYNIKTKEGKTVASLPEGSGKVITAAAANAIDQIYVLTDGYKMYSYSNEDRVITALEISDDAGKWEESTTIAEYAQNIYFLDSQAGVVWKHIPSDNGYSKGHDYLDTVNGSIKNAVDMVIDGDIFILLPDGTIRRFSRGILEESTTAKGLPMPNSTIESPSQLLPAGQGKIFLFDRQHNRLVLLSRNGDYQSQITTDVGTIEAVTINNKAQKIWLLISGKIYEYIY